MAAPRLTWRRAAPGIAIIMAMVAMVVVVLVRARVGAVRGETVRLYALANEARGVIKGTEVWLDGQKVGIVADIGFRAVATDTLERLVLELVVQEQYQPHIRRNSFVAIRSGGRLISSPVIHISSGTTDVPMLAEGDTLHPAMQSDIETLASEVALAARDLKPIVQNVREIMAMADRSRDQLSGARLDDGEVALRAVRRDARIFGERALSGRGTMGLLLRGDSALLDRVDEIVARADSLMEALDATEGTVMRFRSDTLLGAYVASIRNEASILRARLEASAGSLGRFGRDSAIIRQLQRREQLLGELIEDIKRDPGRYIAF